MNAVSKGPNGNRLNERQLLIYQCDRNLPEPDSTERIFLQPSNGPNATHKDDDPRDILP